ncbi:MAG TPA: protein kinase, partial [Byssovorax sp.]
MPPRPMAEEEIYKPRTVLAGRYQVRRELGRGGMGVVYLCRDMVCDERVALKLLARPGAKTRAEDAWWFQEEARALAGLSHEAIVRARDFGTLPDGTPFLVMDAVPGRSLHEWIYLAKHDGPIPWPIVWSTVDQVLSALAHAHARGVIHGDLKPSNVLVDITPDGGEPGVHVLDLGLAWLLQDRVDHRLDGTRATEPTVRWGAGTPGWMAPEQIRFAAPHIGPATDIYALGCILFAMVSGREPFEGDNDELLQQHRNAPIPEPPLFPDVPQGVKGFVVRTLQKRPWHRYEFAADARREWRRFAPVQDAPTMPYATTQLSGAVTPPSAESHRGEGGELMDSATTAGLLGLRPAPFVARAHERQRLLEVAASVAAKGGHAFVLLSGEAGVGKSRLAEWLVEEVHERGLMVPLRARYRKIAAPLDGVVGAVTQHYRLEKADNDVIEKVLMNVWDVPAEDEHEKTWVAAAAEWILPAAASIDASHPHGGSTPTGKRFALDRPELRWLVIRRVFEKIAKHRPVLLWMDDLHHASHTTFEGLINLHREAPHLPLLVVGTVRAEAVHGDVEAAARLGRAIEAFRGERIDLAPLSSIEAHALLRETLPLADEAAEEAAARSKGNPLFALQILHAWAMGGHLTLKDGRYTVPKGSLEVRAATTAELWDERVLAVPAALRRGALAAAALGGDIRVDVLRRLLASLEVDADAAITAMKRAQILLASGDRLRWPHALLQEHLLARLFVDLDASQVFKAAAEALSHHPIAQSRRIVRHRVVNLLRAGEVEQAAHLLHEHTERLWSKARDPASTLRDLAMLDGKLDGLTLATHLRWRAEALRHAGRLEEARHDAEEARTLFADAEDTSNEGLCLRLLGHIASDAGAPAHGRRLVARGLALFQQLGDEHGQAKCEVVLGEIDFLLGEHARARAILAPASERFLKVGDWLGRAQCLLLSGFVEQAGGSAAFARELMRTARADFDAIGYRLGIAQCDVALGHAEHRDGNFDAARAIALSARQTFRDLANPRGDGATERLLAMAALDAGDDREAEQHARAAALVFAKLSDPWGEVETRLLLAQI